MKRRFLELVHLKWVDSEAEIGWEEIKDVIAPLELNQSVGFMVLQDIEKYVIAADYDFSNDHFNRVMKIPKECVKELRVVTIIPLKFSVV